MVSSTLFGNFEEVAKTSSWYPNIETLSNLYFLAKSFNFSKSLSSSPGNQTIKFV